VNFLLRRARSADPDRFAGFLARQGAFVAQKTVLDYCRVKAGRQERQLFASPAFDAALRHCRWSVYLAALADVTALAEAWLRPTVGGRAEEAALAMALVALHARALATETPPADQAEAVRAARAALPGHLAGLQLAAPRPANTLPLLAEAPLFATLPIHADQRRGEEPAIRGALRFHIVAAQQEMERGFDRDGLAARLLGGVARG
jgi:hypothetical protein